MKLNLTSKFVILCLSRIIINMFMLVFLCYNNCTKLHSFSWQLLDLRVYHLSYVPCPRNQLKYLEFPMYI